MRFRIIVVAGLIFAAVAILPAPARAADLCGTVTAYVAPTALTTGVITVGTFTLPIAAGTSVSGAAMLILGSNVCIHFDLTSGSIAGVLTVTANTTTSLHLCGIVSSYTAATSTLAGAITLGSTTLVIAPGAAITNASLLTAGAHVCLDGSVNGAGQIIAPTTASLDLSGTIDLCGLVTGYVAATAGAAGQLQLGGQTLAIAQGTTITGSNLIVPNANLCLSATLDAAGRIVAPSSVTVETTTHLDLCGVVSAFAQSTSTTAGSLTLGGSTLGIAPGALIQGAIL